MRPLPELNLNVGGDPVPRPPPTDRQIAAIEAVVGTRLPRDYVTLLRHSNGGHPELDAFQVVAAGRDEQWSVNWFFHISDDTGAPDSVQWNYGNRWAGAPREVLPIANDGAGNLICLDLRGAGEKVVLWLHEYGDLEPAFVSEAFGQFIDLLEENPDYI